MTKWLFILLLYSCAQVKPSSPLSDEVTLGAALNQARSSYLKGCVDSYLSMNISHQFNNCKERAILHEKELRNIIIPSEVRDENI